MVARPRVVRDLHISVHEGEFLTLLGSSGSGKTTCLMMLAGFEAPDGGCDPPKRAHHPRRAAATTRHRHGVPELRVVSTHDSRRQPVVPVGRARRGQGEGARSCATGPSVGASRRLRRPSPWPTLGGPAATGRHCSRLGIPTQTGADGRTLGRLGPASSGGNAVRDSPHPADVGRDRDLRYARPAGSDGHV